MKSCEFGEVGEIGELLGLRVGRVTRSVPFENANGYTTTGPQRYAVTLGAEPAAVK
jgi:hypothetical protein